MKNVKRKITETKRIDKQTEEEEEEEEEANLLEN